MVGFGSFGLLAQDATPPIMLVNGEVITRTDAFGIEQPVIVGSVRNTGETAYTNITLLGEVYDAQGAVIGEAYGYLVNACGVALLETAIQPGQTRPFEAIVEVYEEETEIATLGILADGTSIPPETPLDWTQLPGITQISTEEVVSVQWFDDSTFAYGVGCDRHIFTTYTWYQYDMAAGTPTPIPVPRGDLINATFIERTAITQSTFGGELDPKLLLRSFLSFAPNGTRLVYQTDIHELFTVAESGYSRRSVHVFLNRYSLQGINWTPDNNFVAYYFGAYGEPVQYLTANANGDLLM
jgi:hypothetical protein